MTFLIVRITVFILTLAGFSDFAFAQVLSPPPGPCSASQLSFNLDNEDGNFVGMSQSGTLLVLRNIGSDACSMPARPTLIFKDAQHHPLAISLSIPRGMYPGPVLLPIVIPAGAEATTQMHWVASDAFDANNCISPAFLSMSVGKETIETPIAGQQFCGPAGQNPSYGLSVLRLDPVYLPSGSLASSYPPPINKLIADYADQCHQLGGTLNADASTPRIMAADFDGDGKLDYVLNPQNLECSAAATAFCGNGGCNIKVAVSGDGYQTPIEILGAQPTISQKETGTELEIWVSRSDCNLSDHSKVCWAIYMWKDGKAIKQYVTKVLESGSTSHKEAINH
ncbi:MAG TPA: DUF4232 domain-containing protein [Coxiellaceae bacterium]|nr:DUF4232 domain-containing protein [Coxiellaceae bacterium]